MKPLRMWFHAVSAHFAHDILDLPLCSIETVADRDENVLMGMILLPFAPDDNLALGYHDVDADMVSGPLATVPMGRLDNDLAGGNPFVETL